MPINVSEAICADTAEIVTVIRYSGGLYVDGVWIPGTMFTFKTLCSVQQPTPSQLQMMPEAERDKDIRLFISKKPIYTTRDRINGEADKISYKGSEYKLIDSADWDSYGHTTAMGAKV